MPSPSALRCPQCLSPVSLGSLAPLGLRGFVIRDTPNLGLECQHCRAKLRIIRTRLYVAQGILLALSFFGLRAWCRLRAKAILMQLNSSSWCACPSPLSAPWCYRRLRRTYCDFGSSAQAKRLRLQPVLPRRTRTLPLAGYALSATKRTQRTSKYAGSANMRGERAPASNNRWRGP
jgi:hypothetical protein